MFTYLQLYLLLLRKQALIASSEYVGSVVIDRIGVEYYCCSTHSISIALVTRFFYMLLLSGTYMNPVIVKLSTQSVFQIPFAFVDCYFSDVFFLIFRPFVVSVTLAIDCKHSSAGGR